MSLQLAAPANPLERHSRFVAVSQYRRIVTRYDKLAANYLAFIQLASVRLSLLVNETTS